MHPFDEPAPALEEGLYSLPRMLTVPTLPDHPYAGARAVLALDTARACAAPTEVQADFSREEKMGWALMERLNARLCITLSRLTVQVPSPVLLRSLAALETAAALARMLPDNPVRAALDFVTPECLDRLYRFAQLEAPSAQPLFQGLIEIMPGRPLIACHRHPYDGVGQPTQASDFLTRISPLLMSALCHGLYCCHLKEAGSLHGECALIAQEHGLLFSSMQPFLPPMERMLLGQEALWYVLTSCQEGEENRDMQSLYHREAQHVLSHILKIRQWIAHRTGGMPPPPPLPPPLLFSPSKGYVRDTLKQVGVTALRDQWVPVGSLPRGADFFRYQRKVCPKAEAVPSHTLVQQRMDREGTDFRFEIAPHPVAALRNRARDETSIGR